MNAAEIGLNSGRKVIATQFLLYPFAKIDKALRLRTLAASKLGNVSTGISFIGSPGWVLGGALVNGLMEAALTEKNNKEGATLLKRAEDEWAQVKNFGVFVGVGEIRNIGAPNPSSWSATVSYIAHLDFRNRSRSELEEICLNHGLKWGDVFKSGVFGDVTLFVSEMDVPLSDNFVYDGDPFIRINGDGGEEHIRWSDVSTYRLLGSD